MNLNTAMKKFEVSSRTGADGKKTHFLRFKGRVVKGGKNAKKRETTGAGKTKTGQATSWKRLAEKANRLGQRRHQETPGDGDPLIVPQDSYATDQRYPQQEEQIAGLDTGHTWPTEDDERGKGGIAPFPEGNKRVKESYKSWAKTSPRENSTRIPRQEGQDAQLRQ